jgi:hypothetical protein
MCFWHWCCQFLFYGSVHCHCKLYVRKGFFQTHPLGKGVNPQQACNKPRATDLQWVPVCPAPSFILFIPKKAWWAQSNLVRVVNDTFQKYRWCSISLSTLKVSSMPIPTPERIKYRHRYFHFRYLAAKIVCCYDTWTTETACMACAHCSIM